MRILVGDTNLVLDDGKAACQLRNDVLLVPQQWFNVWSVTASPVGESGDLIFHKAVKADEIPLTIGKNYED